MPILHVERLGGLANFGGAGAHIRSRGQLDTDTLPAAEQTAVEALFRASGKPKASLVRDGFRYKISRTLAGQTQTIEANEADVPAALVACVQDELV